MSSDPRENKSSQNTHPLQTPALLAHTLSFIAVTKLPALETVSRTWRHIFVTVIWKSILPSNFNAYLHTHFFTPDDVKALTSENDANDDIFKILDAQLQSKGFASKADLEVFRSKSKNAYLIHQSIEERLKKGDLYLLQKCHLRSARVIRAIMDNKFTLDKAIKQIKVSKTFDCIPSQLRGIHMGLTLEEAGGIGGDDVYFSRQHLLCVLAGLNLDQVIRLDIDQAKNLLETTLSEGTEEPYYPPTPPTDPLAISMQLNQFGAWGNKRGTKSLNTETEDPAPKGCCIIC